MNKKTTYFLVLDVSWSHEPEGAKTKFCDKEERILHILLIIKIQLVSFTFLDIVESSTRK